MFFLYTMKDTIRIPADQLASNTIKAIQHEIDCKYPNRVLMDVGLVIGRYHNSSVDCGVPPTGNNDNKNHRKRQRSDGGLIRVGHGVCVPFGESYSGSCHHECIFQLIVYRPFVNEVCVGRIEKSGSDGIHVTTGFFNDIFIPAYWMLNPSFYDAKSGLWIWTPQYDDEDETNAATGIGVKEADFMTDKSTNGVKSEHSFSYNDVENEVVGSQAIAENRYEMEIGSEIRFKVKSINFTQITNTAKGMQATTISMGSSTSNMDKKASSTVGGNTSNSNRSRSGSIEHDSNNNTPVQRIRSSSVTSTDGILNNVRVPSSMQIIGSICEDGLGLTTWWKSSDLEEDEEDVCVVDDERNARLDDNSVYFKTEDC